MCLSYIFTLYLSGGAFDLAVPDREDWIEAL